MANKEFKECIKDSPLGKTIADYEAGIRSAQRIIKAILTLKIQRL